MLRSADEARLTADQKLEPARAKIEEMRLKEQAAVAVRAAVCGTARRSARRLGRPARAAEGVGPCEHAAGRDRAPDAGDRRARRRQPRRARRAHRRRSERKDYLDAQAPDLTEAMTTLESAIRQIDRESRELLQQTFDTVNVNFGKLFPTLFGGGQARAAADRRGDPRFGRAGDRATAGQAQHVDPPAVRRREIADGDRARVRAVPAQSGAVLPARRGRRAARRSEHRSLLRPGAHDG